MESTTQTPTGTYIRLGVVLHIIAAALTATRPDAAAIIQGAAEAHAVGPAERIVELITSDRWIRMIEGKIAAEGKNSLGEIPLVHIQNSVAAFEYSGASDVEF